MQEDEVVEFFMPMMQSYIILIFGVLVNFALMIINIVFAIKDNSATENDRLIWVLLLVFVSVIAHPLYWYLRIWSNQNFSIGDSPTDRTN